MLIAIGLAGIVIFIAVGLFAATRRSLFTEDEFKEGKHPVGYYRNIGTATCILLGILVGLFMGNVPGGAAIGIGIGLILGPYLEKKYNGETGVLSEAEKQERKNRKGVGVIAMVFLILVTLIGAILEWSR